jgi:hypothetical protein
MDRQRILWLFQNNEFGVIVLFWFVRGFLVIIATIAFAIYLAFGLRTVAFHLNIFCVVRQ